MGLFDWFAADIACRACGARTGPDRGTGAQTKLHASPRQNYLRVGSELPVTPESAEDAGYTVLRRPSGPEARILQRWECPKCRDVNQWLEVVVRGGKITSIESVVPERDTLARAHFVDEDDLGSLPQNPGPTA